MYDQSTVYSKLQRSGVKKCRKLCFSHESEGGFCDFIWGQPQKTLFYLCDQNGSNSGCGDSCFGLNSSIVPPVALTFTTTHCIIKLIMIIVIGYSQFSFQVWQSVCLVCTLIAALLLNISTYLKQIRWNMLISQLYAQVPYVCFGV